MVNKTKLEIRPIGGLNTTDNYATLQNGQVLQSDNMLYENGQVSSRPGIVSVAIGGVVGPVAFGRSLYAQTTEYNILITTGNKLYYFPGVEITPAAGAAVFGNAQYNNVVGIQGYVVCGNNPGGIVVWNPSGGTYAIYAAGVYRYIVGHKGRAVAAYRIAGGSTLTNARTFAWCKPGDLTTWTATDGSAGELAMAEAEDEVTGLGVLHNVVVILRNGGIHLAYETGTLPLPYNVQAFSRQGVGCFYPATAAWNDQCVAFVGQDDVYLFDLQNLTPIGHDIRDQLITLLKQGVLYVGEWTRMDYQGTARWRYHLFPQSSASSPHFIFDWWSKSWSTHSYAAGYKWAWNFANPSPGALEYGLGAVDGANPPNVMLWNKLTACERDASFTVYFEGDQSCDYKVIDALIRVRDLTGATPSGPATITLTLTGILNDGKVTATTTSITPGSGTALNKWIRAWFRGTNGPQMVGNNFEAQITVTGGAPFACDYIALFLEETGGYRGA